MIQSVLIRYNTHDIPKRINTFASARTPNSFAQRTHKTYTNDIIVVGIFTRVSIAKTETLAETIFVLIPFT